MNAIAGLYIRFRHLIHEMTKFGIVGALGFVVSLAGADVLHYDLGAGKYKAVTVATLAATVVTFLGNRYWTYRNRPKRGTAREAVIFFVMNGIGILIQYACIALIVDAAGRHGAAWYNGANLLGIMIGTAFRFYSYRKWVWHPPIGDVREDHESLEPASATVPDHGGRSGQGDGPGTLR